MRIIFLGPTASGQTSLMRCNAIKRLGHEVYPVDTVAPWVSATWFSRNLQKRLQCGPIIDKINSLVLKSVRKLRPDLIWAEKQEFLRVETLHELRKLGVRLIHFTPDPYFFLDWKRTRLMDSAIKEFDVLVYCKAYEQAQYQALGKPLVYMPLGFCDEVHRPTPAYDSLWHCDVGFLGAWEPRREELLEQFVAAGLNLKIWGAYWDGVKDGKWSLRRQLIMNQLAGGQPYKIRKNKMLAGCIVGGEVYHNDYAKALTSAKIGIGFLRKVCPDQHTTRTFEIPACGSMLLADRTDEHRQFFEEGKEAEFFSSSEELLDKAVFYCKDLNAQQKIAKNGYDRSLKSEYAYIHRLRRVFERIGRI